MVIARKLQEASQIANSEVVVLLNLLCSLEGEDGNMQLGRAWHDLTGAVCALLVLAKPVLTKAFAHHPENKLLAPHQFTHEVCAENAEASQSKLVRPLHALHGHKLGILPLISSAHASSIQQCLLCRATVLSSNSSRSAVLKEFIGFFKPNAAAVHHLAALLMLTVLQSASAHVEWP